ncbi:MAG: RseA family anti-sigma factor [Sedimenticolaceae bacterium]
MNEQQGELTSSLLDGELSRDAQQRVVTTMLGAAHDEMDRFGRYRLIGDVIRGESGVLAVSVADRVHEALDEEPAVLAPRRLMPRQWLRPVAGLAVAASVAAAAVVVAPQLMTETGTSGQPVQLAADYQRPSMSPALVAAGPTGTAAQSGGTGQGDARWQALDKDLEDRLNRLVVEHQEFGGRSGINGPVPHIGFVSYESR